MAYETLYDLKSRKVCWTDWDCDCCPGDIRPNGCRIKLRTDGSTKGTVWVELVCGTKMMWAILEPGELEKINENRSISIGGITEGAGIEAGDLNTVQPPVEG